MSHAASATVGTSPPHTVYSYKRLFTVQVISGHRLLLGLHIQLSAWHVVRYPVLCLFLK